MLEAPQQHAQIIRTRNFCYESKNKINNDIIKKVMKGVIWQLFNVRFYNLAPIPVAVEMFNTVSI